MTNYLLIMGWNEILARTFEGFDKEKHVSPEWLINPATNRKLKLDYLYPDIGIAIRFTGMKAKGQRRKSDWEELEDQSRDEIRRELCRLNGVDLVLIVPHDPFPKEQLRRLQMALGSASRRLAKAKRFKGKVALMAQLNQARKRLDEISRHIEKTEDLTPYAESWRDREAQAIAEAQKVSAAFSNRKINPKRLKVGQKVKHSHFGVGTVTAIEKGEDDNFVTINFFTKGERKFALSLLAGKLVVSRKG